MTTENTLSTAMQELQAASKPILVGNNVLERVVSARWSDSTTFAGTDRTNASLPMSLLYDRIGGDRSAPTPLAAVPTWSAMWELNNTTDDDGKADVVVIMGHNLGSLAAALGSTITVNVDVADDNAFSVNLVTVHTFTVTSDERLVAVGLGVGGNKTYEDIQFFRIRINSTVDFDLINYPRIGEVWFGKRWQMPFQPNRPHDWYASQSGALVETYPGGRDIAVMTHRAKGRYPCTWLHTTHANGVDSQTQLRGFFRATKHGRNCLVMPFPGSADGRKRTMLCRVEESGLIIQEVSFNTQQSTTTFVEQPPFVEQELFP